MDSALKNKLVIVVLSALIGGFFGFLFGQQKLLVSQQTAERSAGEVSVMIDYGDGSIDVFSGPITTSGETLLEFMEREAAAEEIEFDYKEFSGLGALVEKIGAKVNGEDEKYWQYWVNNTYASAGVDSYIPEDGDIILWKFTKPQFEQQ